MLLSSALIATALLSASPAAPVTLRFAWPPNLQGSVKQAYSNRDAPDHAVLESAMEYRFQVQEAPGGLRRMVPSDVKYGQMFDAMSIGEPSIVLFDDRGAFKGVERIKGGFLDRMSEPPLPLPPEKKAELQAQIEALLQSEVKEKWDELTGRWNGVTLVPGKPVKRAVKLGVGSVLARSEVDAVETTTLEAGVACHAAALEKACVRLRVETAPAKALQRGKPDMMGMVTTGATRRVTIVLEPATLVPHSIRTERADTIERHDPDGKGKPEAERYLQLHDVTFSYAPAGSRKL